MEGFIVRSLNRLKSMLMSNKIVTQEGNVLDFKKDAARLKGIYTGNELSIFKPKSNSQTQQGDINSFLRETSAGTTEIIRRNRNLTALIPELIPAMTIWESSIISPVDAQTNSLGFSLDIDYIDQDVKLKLEELYDDVFNKQLDMEDTILKAVRSCLFGGGSYPVLIVPQQNLTMLQYAVNLNQAGNESFTQLENKYTELLKNDNIPTLRKIKELHLKENMEFSFGNEAFSFAQEPTNKQSPNEGWVDFVSRIENVLIEDSELIPKEQYVSMESLKESKTIDHVTSWVKGLKDHIVVSENTQLISTSKDRTENAINEMMEHMNAERDDVVGMFNDMFYGKINRQNSNSIQRGTITLSDEVVSKYEFPLVVNIPEDCVMPVGTTDETIGYFVLTDNWVSPMSKVLMSGYESRFSNNLVDMSVNAIYGPSGPDNPGNKINNLQKYNAAMAVFDVTISKLLEDKLSKLGLSGMTVARHQMINRCLFHHLLQKKEVGLIFVPRHLMVYYATDYRPDGTGKSLLENIEHVLSMRSTLLVSKLLAITRAAVEKTNITVDMSKNVNYLQTMRLIQNTFYNKHSLKLSNDPDAIVRNIFDSRIRFIPKNLEGAPEFSVETAQESTQTVKPDEELLEYYDRGVITGLLIPRSAIQETENTDYATSLVSKNLHFSNVARQKRNIFLKHIDKQTKTIAIYSSYIKDNIKKILSEYYQVVSETESREIDSEVTDRETDNTSVDESTDATTTDTEQTEPEATDDTLGETQPTDSKQMVVFTPQIRRQNAFFNAQLLDEGDESTEPESEQDDPDQGPEYTEEKVSLKPTDRNVIAAKKMSLSEDDLNKLCVQIIYHMKPTLPSPNVIKNKAEFEEINIHLDVLDKLLDVTYSEDLVPFDDNNMKLYLKAQKSKVKRDLTLEFISKIGKQELFNIPENNELGYEWHSELMQVLLNGQKYLSDKKKVYTPIAEGGTPPSSGGF